VEGVAATGTAAIATRTAVSAVKGGHRNSRDEGGGGGAVEEREKRRARGEGESVLRKRLAAHETGAREDRGACVVKLGACSLQACD
jgi:hypothetical protein